jgi:hypothetical protein
MKPNTSHDTAKKRKHSQDSFAKQATDWIADQFTVKKSIKTRREKTDKTGKKVENK